MSGIAPEPRPRGQGLLDLYDRALPVVYGYLVSRVGDRATARAQLARLLELAKAPHVTVRVIPFDLEGFAMASATMLYMGGSVAKLDTVVRDAPHGSIFIDSEAQLNAYRTRFRKVEEVSLAPDRSHDFIHQLAKEL